MKLPPAHFDIYFSYNILSHTTTLNIAVEIWYLYNSLLPSLVTHQKTHIPRAVKILFNTWEVRIHSKALKVKLCLIFRLRRQKQSNYSICMNTQGMPQYGEIITGMVVDIQREWISRCQSSGSFIESWYWLFVYYCPWHNFRQYVSVEKPPCFLASVCIDFIAHQAKDLEVGVMLIPW